MDYHVFILSRIREAVDGGMPTDAAVRHGITVTAGVVTSAALVMVAVFSLFGTLSSLEIKQAGVGLAAAVLIDATIIRAVLLPAIDDAPRRLELVPAARASVAAAGLARRAGRGFGRGSRGDGARVGRLPAEQDERRGREEQHGDDPGADERGRRARRRSRRSRLPIWVAATMNGSEVACSSPATAVAPASASSRR